MKGRWVSRVGTGAGGFPRILGSAFALRGEGTGTMVLQTDQWNDGGAGLRGMWDHELIIACFDRVLGEPFEREELERDDVWVRYKVKAEGEVINSNLILDYGKDEGNGDWQATDKTGADYIAFTFACQLWLDYPTPQEIKAHVDKGLALLETRMETGEGGHIEDTMERARRKIYFEREGLFDLNADPDDITRACLEWAKVALGDVSTAAKYIVYSE